MAKLTKSVRDENSSSVMIAERSSLLPLMSEADSSESIIAVEARKEKSILLTTVTFAANGLFFAAHLVLNGKYLSLVGRSGASASSLMSTYQSVVLGSGVGFLLGTGLDFAKAIGEGDFKEAGDVAKSAARLSMLFGAGAATGMFATKAFFPYLFEKETAEIASDFFVGYGVSSIPLLFIIVGSQVAFVEGDWYVPPAAMLSVLLSSGISSYLLGFEADLGALGIGLGGAIGSALSALGLLAWSRRDNYKKFGFYQAPISDLTVKTKSLLQSGWKLALQRLTEWGNLLAITTVIGVNSNQALKALNPAMLYLILFGTAQQGLAQAAGMLISKNKGKIKLAISDRDTASVMSLHRSTIQALFRSVLIGASLNVSGRSPTPLTETRLQV